MKKVNLKFLLAVIPSIFLLSVNANAVPYIPPDDAPVFIKFNNLEQVDRSGTNSIAVPGGYGTAGNWGLLNVTSIANGAVSDPNLNITGGPVLWSDDGPGGTNGQVTGIFYGINLTSGTTASGGTMDLYWNDAGSDVITANDMSGSTTSPDAAGVTKFTTGTFLARLNFSSGIIDGDSTTTIKSSSDLITGGLNGYAESFADVDTSIVGDWTNLLDGNWFFTDEDNDTIRGEAGEIHDVRFKNSYSPAPLWDDNGTNPTIVGLSSEDPARVYTAPIPEPSSFLLLGFGLLGAASILRRKSNN